jgi:hypothetical protein
VTIKGVNYQLGPDNSEVLQPETLTIKGTWSRSLKGIRTFKGTVTFEHDSIPVPQESRETTVRFTPEGFGVVSYIYLENTSSGGVMPRAYSYGVLFANSDFSSVTFQRMREDEVTTGKSPGRGWNGRDGLMFAGPATTRDQALIISNDLMKKHLNNNYVGGQYVLK